MEIYQKDSSNRNSLQHFITPPQGEVSAVMGGIVPNAAFIFRVFVATPWTLSYLCISSSFYLALILNFQVVNSHSYSITWNILSKY